MKIQPDASHPSGRLCSVVALVFALLTTGCPSTPRCQQSIDCTDGASVCRGGYCRQVPCATDQAQCLAGETCHPVSGKCVPGLPELACTTSGDCPPGNGVCRGGRCTVVPCGEAAPCHGDELCQIGQCAPPPPATPGQTLAAGGSVSTSGEHMHIGVTGQGRAVGSGASSEHQHTTGATSVMRR